MPLILKYFNHYDDILYDDIVWATCLIQRGKVDDI